MKRLIFYILFLLKKNWLGVTNVECSVEQKSVIVTSDDSVTSEDILQKLEKWSSASGKYVKLA